MPETYQELLTRCKHIVATGDTEPVSIPLREPKQNKQKSNWIAAKNDLLSQISNKEYNNE